jgi:hypothetical protein
MKFEKAFVAVLETLSVAMTAANFGVDKTFGCSFLVRVHLGTLRTYNFRILRKMSFFIAVYNIF